MSKPNGNRLPVLGDERFIAKMMERVIQIPETGCWLWTGGWTRGSYGACRFGSYGQELAHRAMYRALVGPVPDGLYVCHKCDTPPCCNPSHLFLGDQFANMRDRKEKGKYYGASNGYAVLNDSLVSSIRAAKGKKTMREIAADHGVSCTAVFNVIHGISWRHVA